MSRKSSSTRFETVPQEDAQSYSFRFSRSGQGTTTPFARIKWIIRLKCWAQVDYISPFWDAYWAPSNVEVFGVALLRRLWLSSEVQSNINGSKQFRIERCTEWCFSVLRRVNV